MRKFYKTKMLDMEEYVGDGYAFALSNGSFSGRGFAQAALKRGRIRDSDACFAVSAVLPRVRKKMEAEGEGTLVYKKADKLWHRDKTGFEDVKRLTKDSLSRLTSDRFEGAIAFTTGKVGKLTAPQRDCLKKVTGLSKKAHKGLLEINSLVGALSKKEEKIVTKHTGPVKVK